MAGRKDPFLTRRLPSQLANRLISAATGVRLHDYGCSLKVFRAEVVKSLKLYGEMHRFLPAIASEQGVTIAETIVNHRERRHGHSKYGIGRTVRVVLDLLTVKFLLSYSTRPLQIFGLVGGAMGLAGTIILGCLGTLRILFHEEITRRLPLTLFGILLLFTGVNSSRSVCSPNAGAGRARDTREALRHPANAGRLITTTCRDLPWSAMESHGGSARSPIPSPWISMELQVDPAALFIQLPGFLRRAGGRRRRRTSRRPSPARRQSARARLPNRAARRCA